MRTETQELLKRAGFGELSEVSEHLGRNENISGISDSGEHVFVKRLTVSSVRSGLAVRRRVDSECFASNVRFESFRQPRLLHYDKEHHLLVFEFLHDVTRMNELLGSNGASEALAEAGQALGELHATEAHQRKHLHHTGSWRPPVNDLACLSVDEYLSASAGMLGVFRLLQVDEELRISLLRLEKDSSRADKRPVHGDIRLDQFLFSGGAMYLTDWEEFHEGDPAHDIGCMVGEILLQELSQIADQKVDNASPAHGQIIERGVKKIIHSRPAVHSFWEGYLSRFPHLDEHFVNRVTRFAGWHFFDRLLADSMMRVQLSPVTTAMAGVGRKLMVDPDRFHMITFPVNGFRA